MKIYGLRLLWARIKDYFKLEKIRLAICYRQYIWNDLEKDI